MPLEDPTVIDLVLKPDANGKICLVITDSGATTDPAGRRQLLVEKVQNYARMVWDGGFVHDYPDKHASDFIIKVVCQQPPTDAMREISSIGELSHQIPVLFEIEPTGIAAGTEAADGPEPEYLWSDVLAQAFAEFSHDQKFFAMQTEMLTAALASAGMMNFVFGRAYRADGTPGEIITINQGQPTEETAGPEIIAQARARGQQAGREFDHWFVIYTTMREAEELEEPQLWVVAEGWKRGQNRGIAIGQIFERDDSPHPVGEPQLIGIVPVDVFATPGVAASKPAAPPKPPKKFPWRLVAGLMIAMMMAAAAYAMYQTYPTWWKADASATANTTPASTPSPTNLSNATATLPANMDDSTNELTIDYAEFGSGKHVTDVTLALQKLLQERSAGFKADAATLGIDPQPGKRKHLNIQYHYHGTAYSFSFPAAKKMSAQSLIDRTRSQK